MYRPRVKICCISSVDEANMAIDYGADALGLVGHMPSGPGIISDQLIREIARATPPPISTFLLTSETTPQEIVEHHKQVNTNTIQIVDELRHKDYVALRQQLPNVKLVQVVHVLNEDSVDEAVEVSSHVDAILLDSGNPNLSIKVLGGTGKTHNWELSKKINELISIPLFLAGGLNPSNVKEAIETVRPFGVDLCSGVRTNGKLNEKKLKAFFDAIP